MVTGEIDMRFHTSLALGFFTVAACGACGSSDEENTAPVVPPYSSAALNPAIPNGAAVSANGNGGDVGATAEAPQDNDTSGNSSAEDAATTNSENGNMAAELDQSAAETETGSAQMDPQDMAAEDTTDTEPDVEEQTNPDPNTPTTQVFLLLGQSNMWGVPNPQQQDMDINPRVEVLTLSNCGRHGVDQWVPAQPPLHGCVGQIGTGSNGPGVGPGDYFAKTIADAFPEDTILLVPTAIPGASIDVFQPGQQDYNSIVRRARLAQERGEIRGMIFHQGESDTNQGTWPGRVKNVVDQLRSDLALDDVPLIAGELLIGGCCQSHNTLVSQLTNDITNTSVASAAGFAPVPDDGFGNLHFDLPSQREFGRRYGQLMLQALGQ